MVLRDVSIDDCVTEGHGERIESSDEQPIGLLLLGCGRITGRNDGCEYIEWVNTWDSASRLQIKFKLTSKQLIKLHQVWQATRTDDRLVGSIARHVKVHGTT